MKKKIIIITTGGTIAMKKDENTGGLVPAVSGGDLVSAIPGLSHAADIEVREFSNIPSGWMTVEKMFALSREIDKLAAENAADGFVITHGTDTLEETAFFLYITLRTENPYVLQVPCGVVMKSVPTALKIYYLPSELPPMT